MLSLFIANVNTMNRIIGLHWQWYTAVIKDLNQQIKGNQKRRNISNEY